MTPRTLAAVAAAVLVLLASCVGAGSPSVAAQTGESESTNGSPNPTVTVGTVDREGTEETACTQAIVEVEYTAIARFQQGLPGRVVVEHDHGDGPVLVTDQSR